MFAKGFTVALLLVGFVLVANVRCSTEQEVEPESLPIRVRRQLPGIPSIPGAPDPSSLPGVNTFKNAGSGLAKNIPGADSIPGVPKTKRSADSGASDVDTLMARVRREARGTGNLPTNRSG